MLITLLTACFSECGVLPGTASSPDLVDVTEDGGRFTSATGLILDIPAGAVSTDVTIEVVLEPAPAGFLGEHAYSIHLLPAGLEFIQPISLQIPTPPGGDYRVYVDNEYGGFRQPGETLDGMLQTSVTVLGQNIVAINDDIEEITIIAPPAALDVLFVVDNSCSMYEEQQALALAFPALVDWFADTDIDYHLGVISTDALDRAGELRTAGGVDHIDPSTPDAAQIFSEMARMGTVGSYEEQGFRTARLAIEDTVGNAGFYREEAPLHLVFVSDEEEQSEAPLGDVIDWMHGLKDVQQDVRAHAVVGIPGEECFAVDTVGLRYIEATEETGGSLHNLCDDDWSDTLSNVGFQAAGWERVYLLEHPADETTLSVSADQPDGSELVYDPADYVYDPDLPGIVFTGENVPAPGIVVRLSYEPL